MVSFFKLGIPGHNNFEFFREAIQDSWYTENSFCSCSGIVSKNTQVRFLNQSYKGLTIALILYEIDFDSEDTSYTYVHSQKYTLSYRIKKRKITKPGNFLTSLTAVFTSKLLQITLYNAIILLNMSVRNMLHSTN